MYFKIYNINKSMLCEHRLNLLSCKIIYNKYIVKIVNVVNRSHSLLFLKAKH